MKKAVLVLATGVSLLGPSAAQGSQLIDRDASNVRLAVASDGVALVTYQTGGVLKHVVAYGAMNALAPSPSTPQVAFKLDFSGGVKSFRKRLWSGFRNACTPVSVPVVTYQVAACVAPDGSYWALQSWQRGLPNYGVAPTKAQAAFELRLSHWAGGLATLSTQTGWAYRKYDQLFGQLSYADQPVFGFRSTAAGVPLDTYGRNLYLDTLDSAYGRGWMRENSFLVHGPGGTFCYGLYPHGSRPAGTGRRYRITVIGPGVTPDVVWEGPSPGAYDPARASAQASLQRTLMGRDVSCRPHP